MKLLTGQCEKDFETWFETYESNTDIFDLSFIGGSYIGRSLDLQDVFYNLPISMQFGVIQEFADSVEDDIESRVLAKVSRGYEKYYSEIKGIMQVFNSRHEAQKEAIIKFNEIYNKQE
ncbi:hypothetical protein [Joostella sp.]|uniref:hypothetical protein n=1 Tax=Joostella sp. TaxID=2231138 RepID=UPI003A93BCAA